MKMQPQQYARAYLSAVASVPPAKRHQVARNLWRAVWRRGHGKWSKHIIVAVQQLIRERSGIVLAEVATPQPLTETQKSNLSRQLAKAVGQPIELVCAVKPHLLAGVVVTIDDRRYDASLKGRLDALYGALAGETKSSA